jgi:predicted DNA-binding transcriptional regulator AlpA
MTDIFESKLQAALRSAVDTDWPRLRTIIEAALTRAKHNKDRAALSVATTVEGERSLLLAALRPLISLVESDMRPISTREGESQICTDSHADRDLPTPAPNKPSDPTMNTDVSILRPSAVDALIGLSASQRDRLERAGKFPKRVRLVPGGRAVGYRSDEVKEWIEARPRAEDAPADFGGDPRRRGVGKKSRASA